MKKSTAILFSLLFAAAGATAFAQDTNSSNDLDLKSFNIILENNIFDQSRTSLASFSPRPRVPRVERLTLLGIGGDFGKGDIIFGGSDAPDHLVNVGDHVRGFLVKSATLDTVQLSNGSNTFVLQVPSGLRRVDDGPWEKSYEDIDSAPAPAAGNSDDSTAAALSPAAAAADAAAHPGESDVLRKLRLRREQEEK